MVPSAQYASLPFTDAIAAFRNKLNLPTEYWDELWQDQHARAFTVAGATRESLLCDIRQAVDKAISQGTTLEEFRQDFAGICDRAGWDPKGGQAWRARVIYKTNLSTAYAAGRYKAMTDPDVRAARPFWRYLRSSAEHPRLAHLLWVGVTLRWDDPWWDTHFPPNGWGCECGVTSCSARELEQLTREEADGAHPIKTEAPAEATYEWTDPRTGEVRQIPKGIDPGWAYNPGRAAWGEQQSGEAWEAWKASGEKIWERITDGLSSGDWESAGRPKLIPADAPKAQFGPAAGSREELVAQLRELFGGEQTVCTFTADSGFRYDLVTTAEAVGNHLALDRAPFAPFLRETIEDPFEVWSCFERNRFTGKVRLTTRFVKMLALPDGKRGLLVVAQANHGCLETWTAMPVHQLNYIQRQRIGMLMWGRRIG